MWNRLGALVLVVLALAASACSDDDEAASEGKLLVFAASSLGHAFAEIESAFESANPGTDVQVNFAGSSSLREQILEGAPAAVFASASESIMTELVDADEIGDEPVTFARNALQIAVPKGNPGGVEGLEDFADADLLIGLCAEGVPCGDLAREALASAGVQPSVDTNEPDVLALVTKVAADELDAGLVYVSDVVGAERGVEGIDLPDDNNVVAHYPIATLSNAPNQALASEFAEFVLSAEGQSILSRFGFGAP